MDPDGKMFAGCRCCFKGGGAIRGPQSSGLVLGKESWVAACRDNAFPNRAVSPDHWESAFSALRFPKTPGKNYCADRSAAQ